MTQFRISRRELVASAGVAGIGVTTSTVARANRLTDNIDWFEGRLIAVSASGETRDLCGVRGYNWRRRTRGWYFDAGNASIETMINPLTGATIKPQPFSFETAGDLSGMEENGFITFEETARIAISGTNGASVVRRAVHVADMQDNTRRSIPVTGHWTFVAPWLPWLEMGDALGHCQFDCRIGGGMATLAELPARFQQPIS